MDNKLNYTEENEEREDGKLSYRTPIYLQLREIIRNRIEEGEYLPGTAIPSENKLAETYGINRLTVRNAVDALVNEGILRRVQGKGVFVVGDKYEENLDEHGGFVNVMSSGTKRVSIKEQAKIYRPAGNKYANYFNIDPTLVRLAFVLIAMGAGSGILAYIILWIVSHWQLKIYMYQKMFCRS